MSEDELWQDGNATENDTGATEEKPCLLIVDDDVFMRTTLDEALGGDYRIVQAGNGTDAVAAVQSGRIDLVILDVEMPGMDGYETCRQIKQTENGAAVPVIFLSAHDKTEDRLTGYDAGGEDYLLKPFDPLELRAKIGHLLKSRQEYASSREMASYASSTAMSAMTSLGELGTVLETLKAFNASHDLSSLADAALQGLASFGLSGVIQIRAGDDTVTRSSHGRATPLELSVISNMSHMERIVQFKSRLSVTYDHASLLVTDMPVEDPERCGRLRDHLAMLADGTNVRAAALEIGLESARRGIAIKQAVDRITSILGDIDTEQRQNRIALSLEVSAFIDRVENAILSVALTEAQDAYLTGIIQQGLDKIIDFVSHEVDIQNKLSSLVKELKNVAGAD